MSADEGCGKVGIPKGFPRLRSHRLFHSPVPPRNCAAVQRPSWSRVVAHARRPLANAQRPVQRLVDRHPASGQRGPPGSFLDLQHATLQAHRRVSVHHPFVLPSEDPVPIGSPAGHQRRTLLGRPDRKTAVELPDVLLPQKLIGCLHGGDPVQAQLLGQLSLPGAEVALASAAGLRRIGRDHLDAQLPQRAAHRGQPLPVHDLPSLRRQKEMAGPAAVQRAEHAACGASPAGAAWPPGPLPARRASPRCSSGGCRAPPAASRESAARCSQNTSPHTTPAPARQSPRPPARGLGVPRRRSYSPS